MAKKKESAVNLDYVAVETESIIALGRLLLVAEYRKQ
jgi:hypothetical protein